MKAARRMLMLASSFAALSGCGLEPAPPSPEPAPAPGAAPGAAVPLPPRPRLFAGGWVPMGVGERWIYSACWNGIPVGTAEIHAEGIRTVKGRRALTVRCVIRPNGYIDALYHVRDEIATDIDLETGWPLRFAKHIEEGKRLKDEYIEFDPAGKTATYYARKTGEGETDFVPVAVMAVPEGIHDPLSSLFAARALPLKDGDVSVVAVNTDEKTYPTELKVLGRGAFYAGSFGDVTAIRIEPHLDYDGIFPPRKGKLSLWVEEATRVPLRILVEIKIGTVDGELVRCEGGPAFKPLRKIPDSERIGRRP